MEITLNWTKTERDLPKQKTNSIYSFQNRNRHPPQQVFDTILS